MHLKFIFLLLTLGTTNGIFAQGFAFSPDLLSLAKKFDLQLSTPTENRFKEIRQLQNNYLPYVYGMQSAIADLDIYVSFQAYDSLNQATSNPAIETTRLMTNAAINKEDALITVLDLGKTYVQETFGADWGKEIYFKPKKGLSDKEHCRMVSIFKEDTGLLTLFFFFDEKTHYLDSYYNWIRFAEW
jgi:hypothetical protein